MELNKCMGCMEDFSGYPCPRCGFSPEKNERMEFTLPPETILAGKYLVGRMLGQGGFGITYIGWDIAQARKVAIKEYYPSGQVSRSPGTRKLTWYSSDTARQAKQDGMNLFLKEARKMSKVQRIPGVVQVLDQFQENDTAYIVMDYVDGQTLNAKLKAVGRPMTWEQAGPLFRQVIHAMEKVHSAELIHRDLSPDNLMLTKDGRVEILDLGAAKDLAVNKGASSMQVAKGGFSPLEQYIERGGSGTWTDVYAMAATIYYTITGKLLPSAVDRLNEDTVSWDLPQLKALPKPVLYGLKHALAVQSKERTQTMEALEKDLYLRRRVPKPVDKRKLMRRAAACGAAVLLCGVGIWLAASNAARKNTYQSALTQLHQGSYLAAIQGFSGLNYKDSGEKAQQAKELYWRTQRQALAAGNRHSVGLRADGTAVAAGFNEVGQCDVERWTNLVSVSAGVSHTVGLRENGTVVSAGPNYFGECDLADWENIVAVSAGDNVTVGLRRDGTVVAQGYEGSGVKEASGWTDIVAVSAGAGHIVGLHTDGTVVAEGKNDDGQCDVAAWTDIVAVSAGAGHTVGLRADGTVVAVGRNDDGQCGTEGWTDIAAVSAGATHTVALRRDGTLAAVGANWDGQCDVTHWNDISAIAAGADAYYTLALRANGTVAAAGTQDDGACAVDDWRDIAVLTPEELAQMQEELTGESLPVVEPDDPDPTLESTSVSSNHPVAQPDDPDNAYNYPASGSSGSHSSESGNSGTSDSGSSDSPAGPTGGSTAGSGESGSTGGTGSSSAGGTGSSSTGSAGSSSGSGSSGSAGNGSAGSGSTGGTGSSSGNGSSGGSGGSSGGTGGGIQIDDSEVSFKPGDGGSSGGSGSSSGGGADLPVVEPDDPDLDF